ncbi:MAG: arylsulfatase, partial [Verrucomicrobiales bacterium]
LTQTAKGQDVWDGTYTPHRFPRICDLRADPFENAQQPNASMAWQDWQFRRAFLLVPAQGIVGGFVKSFVDFPPRGKPASFSVGDALKKLSEPQHN